LLLWLEASKSCTEVTTHRVANFGRSTRKDKHSTFTVSGIDIVGGYILTTFDSGERVRGRNQWSSQKKGEEIFDKHLDEG